MGEKNKDFTISVKTFFKKYLIFLRICLKKKKN